MTERQLIVLRHAKSSWKYEELRDHERPLNGRGRRDAPAVGAYLNRHFWPPDVVLCSDSTRTTETWTRMAECFSIAPKVQYTGRLYHAGMGEVRQELSYVEDNVRSTMVIGHNPGWEFVVGWLADVDIRMTTCNAAVLRGRGETWEQAISERGSWKLMDVVRPKEI